MFSNVGLTADNEEADPESISEMSQALSNLQEQLFSDDDDEEVPPDWPSSGGISFEIPEEAKKSIFKILGHSNVFVSPGEAQTFGEIELVLDGDDNVFECSREKFVGKAIFNNEGAAKEMIDIDFEEGLTAEDLIDVACHSFRKKWGLKYDDDMISEEDEDEEEEEEEGSASRKKRKKGPAKKKASAKKMKASATNKKTTAQRKSNRRK